MYEPKGVEPKQGDNRKNVGISFMPKDEEEYAYQTGHRPPDENYGAPMHEVTRGIYPDDFYTLPYNTALQYYAGGGMGKADNESMKAIRSVRGKPDAEITIYRSVPKSTDNPEIHAGDWVTPSKTYAKDHGEAWLKGDYTILSKKVPASHLFTEGNSINEFGYNPLKKSDIRPSDDAHRAAVESGDTEEAQRLVDEAAKKAGYTIGPLWHGTSGDFYEFRPSGDEKAIFLSTDKNEAKAFATGKGGKVMGPLYVKATGPDKLYHATEEREAIQKARKKGYTGIKVTDQLPYSTYTMKPQRQIVNYAVFDPNQIKSADPATYDKDGNLIPLSQRFNPTSSDIRFMPADNEPNITKEGHVFPNDISKPFQFTKNVAINFMPATAKVDLEDYADYPIIALTADRMGIGQAFVGPQGAKQPLSVPRQGGAGFSTLYTDEEHNPVWGFSDEATANRFQKRVDDVAAEAKTPSVLVAPTLLSSDNHLHNLTGQMAYSEAIEAAMKSGFIDQDTINAHIQEIANRISTSKNAKQPQAMRDKFSKIKNYADLKKAINEGSLNFADAAWLKEKAGMRTLPIKADEMQRLGILPAEVAKDLVHEGFYHLPNFSVVSLFEVPAGQKAEKGDYHKSYPYIVRGKAIGYLKNIYNLANLTSDPKVKTKSGEITAQPVMVVMPKLDPVLVKNALSTLKAYTPQSNQ